MKYGLTSFVLMLSLLSCGEKNQTSERKPLEEKNAIRILFLGDSLTAGYGLLSYEDAWPHLVVKKLQTDGHSVQLTNAGVSGDTSSGGLGRLEWVLAEKPDIFVLELGANDMLRGIPAHVTKENLRKIIQLTRAQYPDVQILLVGMYATPNLGKKFAKEFNAIYPDLAKEEFVHLLPFLLEKVAGIRKFNQKDGIHPTEAGHALVAETVYPFLQKLVVSRH